MRIALETAQQLKEGLRLGILLAAAFVSVQVAFFKESPIVVAKIVLSLFFLFVLPGWCMLYIWREKFGFLERTTAGTILAAAVFLIFTYFTGFIGLKVNISTWIAPFIGYGAFIIQIFGPKLNGKARKN